MQSIERVSVVQRVVEGIKEYILSSGLKEKDKLPTEKEFCRQLQVGRSTLREALRILEATNFVVIKPGKGAFVGNMKAVVVEEVVDWFVEHEVELMDFIEVRMAIEPLAVRLAIKRATPRDVALLQSIHEKFLHAVESNDTAQITLMDEQFHNTIVEITRNKLLISINKKINVYFKSFRSRTFQLPQNASNAVVPHTAILEAIIRRETESGEEQMKMHIDHVRRDLECITRNS